MEVLAGFLAGVLLNYYALGVIILIGIVLDHNEHEIWSAITLVVSVLIARKTFELDTAIEWWQFAIAYVVLGVLVSMWRYRRYVASAVESNKDSRGEYRDALVARLAPEYNVDRITAWIVNWPFALVVNIVGDVYDVLSTFVTRTFKGAYRYIYQSAIKQ